MYLFNTNLRVGDIVLVRGAAKHSKTIAMMTKGHFSHAMLVLENGIFLEAITGSGVQTTSQLRVSFADLSNVVVLRYDFPDEQTESSVLSYITKNFSGYQGKKYSYKGALESIRKSGGDNTSGGYFCSHLVASMYADSGFALLDKPAHKVTPNDLLHSKVLVDVTEEVISPFSDVTIERIKSKGEEINCIDAGGNTLSLDALNHSKLLKNTAKYFTRNGLPAPHSCSEFPGILTDSMNAHFASELDYQISKQYKKIGINKYIASGSDGVDFKSDLRTLMSEIDRFGYDHAHDAYTDYNYALLTISVKRNNMSSNHGYYHAFCNEWEFKYFSLKLEYYSLILKAIDGTIEGLLYLMKGIEDRFPDRFDELQETKAMIVAYVVSKQVDPEQKKALMDIMRNASHA